MTDKKSKLPHECTNLTEVRNEIDRIDSDIIQLLATRFNYVREVVKYKKNTNESIEASDRRAAVIASRAQWAADKGLDADVIGRIYDILIDYFIQEEKKIITKKKCLCTERKSKCWTAQYATAD